MLATGKCIAARNWCFLVSSPGVACLAGGVVRRVEHQQLGLRAEGRFQLCGIYAPAGRVQLHDAAGEEREQGASSGKPAWASACVPCSQLGTCRHNRALCTPLKLGCVPAAGFVCFLPLRGCTHRDPSACSWLTVAPRPLAAPSAGTSRTAVQRR